MLPSATDDSEVETVTSRLDKIPTTTAVAARVILIDPFSVSAHSCATKIVYEINSHLARFCVG